MLLAVIAWEYPLITRTGRRIGTLLAALWVAATPAPAAEMFPPEVMKSVVSLLPEWPGFTKGAPGSGGRLEEPEGTAVAVLPGGYLATNVHVIGRAKTVKIRLADGRLLVAEIVGQDPATDIALVKGAADFPVPETAPPPALGAKVCAIGNQFGLGLSVTCGVVSAIHRTGTGFNPIEDFIQTDAVVNPGGSGGALVDGAGRLVGLVSAIFTKNSDANIGVNFAASMKLVMRVVRDLRDHGRVIRGRPGFRVRDLTDDEHAHVAGAAVDRLDRDGPAIGAGLRVGDIVTAVGERAIRRASDVVAAVHMFRPGEPVQIEVLRGGNAATLRLVMAPES